MAAEAEMHANDAASSASEAETAFENTQALTQQAQESTESAQEYARQAQASAETAAGSESNAAFSQRQAHEDMLATESIREDVTELKNDVTDLKDDVTRMRSQVFQSVNEAAESATSAADSAAAAAVSVQEVHDAAEDIVATTTTSAETAVRSANTAQEAARNASSYAVRAENAGNTAESAATRASTNANNASRYATNARNYAASAERYATDAESAKEEIERLAIEQNRAIAPVQERQSANQAYNIGDYFVYNNRLYQVTSAIGKDETILPGTNCVQTTVTDEIKDIQTMDIHICTVGEYDSETGLPTIQNPDSKTFYLVPGGDAPNLYVEWVYTNNAWEQFGSATIDLSGYITDVKTNNVSVVENGVANIQKASENNLGVVGIEPQSGVIIQSNGKLELNPASSADIKRGENTNKPIAPFKQEVATFYGLAKAAGDNTQSQSNNAVGVYTDEAKSSIRSMLSAAAVSDIPSVPVQDVQVNGVSVVNQGVANIPKASNTVAGVLKTATTYGTAVQDGIVYLVRAISSQIKDGAAYFNPIVPNLQHESTFYGLAKAAGDTTQSQSANAVGTYTAEAKAAIQNMLGIESGIPEIPVEDVQVNGVSVLNQGVANVPVASDNVFGVMKIMASNGIALDVNKRAYIFNATSAIIKAGTNETRPITPNRQQESVFYGLAKAAGDSTQSSSSNAVGTYTDAAKVAIQKMLGIYQAPWELIREDTFTNASESDHTITVDGNGQSFELTDAILLFETPVQDVESSKGNYGSIFFNDGSSNVATVYCNAWTQAANSAANGCAVIAESKDGLFFTIAKMKSTATNMGNLAMGYNSDWGNNQYVGIKYGSFVIRKIIISTVKGTGHYKLYGKRKWE